MDKLQELILLRNKLINNKRDKLELLNTVTNTTTVIKVLRFKEYLDKLVNTTNNLLDNYEYYYLCR